MYRKLQKLAANLLTGVRSFFMRRIYRNKSGDNKFADSNFRGYRCQNCGAFFYKEKFGEMVDRTTSVKISKPYLKYSDEYQQQKPEIDDPSRETTDYCPECSENREDIRRFKLIYRKENNVEK